MQVDLQALPAYNTEELEQLKQQNESLKAVIKEMRMQMEDLGHDLPKSDLEDLPPKSESSYATKGMLNMLMGTC